MTLVVIATSTKTRAHFLLRQLQSKQFSHANYKLYYIVILTQTTTRMVHHDPRVEWIKNAVCVLFDLPDSGYFEELLSRGDGEEEQTITSFLNIVTEEEAPSTLFFFKNVREEEVEVEIPVGTFIFQRN